MTTTAIICEFNPLHYGHKKLIDYAKTFSNKVICIMTGNFTQRGMPACADKYLRATHAIKAGADLVIELPTVFAAASAENFALGGVNIADKLQVDYLLFGSECGDINKLKNCAQMLSDKQINAQIVEEMSRGVSYPKAVSLATKTDILNTPNNVLAIEYLRALNKINSSIKPITIKREDNYNGKPQEYSSSGYLRKNIDCRGKYTFDYVIKDIDDNVEKEYCRLATQMLALADCEELKHIEGVTEGLENRVFSADKSLGYENFIEQIKTKRYTRLKLQRVILYAVLGITKSIVETYKNLPVNLKVLAVKSSETPLLANIQNESDDITKKADRLYYALTGQKAPIKLLKID